MRARAAEAADAARVKLPKPGPPQPIRLTKRAAAATHDPATFHTLYYVMSLAAQVDYLLHSHVGRAYQKRQDKINSALKK